jgi:hypothetical protein
MKYKYPNTIEGAVAVLNIARPGWREKIDVEKLDMGEWANCILGQVFGDYYKGFKELFDSPASEYEWVSYGRDEVFGSRASIKAWIKFIEQGQAPQENKKGMKTSVSITPPQVERIETFTAEQILGGPGVWEVWNHSLGHDGDMVVVLPNRQGIYVTEEGVCEGFILDGWSGHYFVKSNKKVKLEFEN